MQKLSYLPRTTKSFTTKKEKELPVKDFKTVNLQNGDYIIVRRKPNSSSIEECLDNKSEIQIDFSDCEEFQSSKISQDDDTINNVESSIFEDLSSSSIKSDSKNSNSSVISLEDTIDLKKNIAGSQINMNARIMDSYWKNKKDLEDINQSSLLCIYQNKYQFHLRFWTVNVKMKFIRHTERRMTDELCEKFVQPKSYHQYTTYIDPNSSRQMLTKKEHILIIQDSRAKIPKSDNAAHQSAQKTGKETKRGNPISQMKKLKLKSCVNLSYNSVTFITYPPTLTIDSMRHIVDEEGRPHSDSDSKHRNCGSILLKYKQDLLLFKFDMIHITFDQVWMKTSRGTQSKDFNNYIRYFSLPCNKKLHCPIPISTYKYRDPLVKIRYNNRNRYMNGIRPTWIKEERRKRLKRFCQLKEISSARKFELGYSSTLQFESHFGSFCKVRTKLQRGILVEGDYHYERMAINYQRQKLGVRKKDKESLFMNDVKHASMQVLDCNLSQFDF